MCVCVVLSYVVSSLGNSECSLTNSEPSLTHVHMSHAFSMHTFKLSISSIRSAASWIPSCS